MEIIVTLEEFLNRFVYLRDKGITEQDLQSSYVNAKTFISTTLNTINLVPDLQINGVYLACAHCLYLQLNPSLISGMEQNTSQDSESVAMKQRPVKNWFDYYLGLTLYGMQLLAILTAIQPPLIDKPLNLYPYYNNLTN